MEIQTFVFFDLETTGLIREKNMPKITEIALIAVARESIYNSDKRFLPRVLHKLVLPINPQKIISPKAEHMTKLFNEDMRLLQPFDCEVYEIITQFLKRLKSPICFAAHNGKRFDYPIFLWELKCINKIFDDSILCVDTWEMFKDFFNNKHNLESKETQDLLNDEFNDSLSKLDMDVPMIEEEVIATMSTLGSTLPYNGYINDTKHDEQYSDVQCKANERTPVSQMIRPQNICVERPFKKNLKRRLNFTCEKPTNLQLSTIYEYMFGSTFMFRHSAEADCLALINCVISINDFFVRWSDSHASSLFRCEKHAE